MAMPKAKILFHSRKMLHLTMPGTPTDPSSKAHATCHLKEKVKGEREQLTAHHNRRFGVGCFRGKAEQTAARNSLRKQFRSNSQEQRRKAEV